MLSPLASARHCFPIFALGIEYFFAYQPTAENALEVLVVQKEVRRKWILNICIQNRRSSKFRFLFLVGNSYGIITHNSCRWQAVECQIKDWSIFEQTFTKWWMEQFHSCLCILGHYQRPQQVISVGTSGIFCIWQNPTQIWLFDKFKCHS